MWQRRHPQANLPIPYITPSNLANTLETIRAMFGVSSVEAILAANGLSEGAALTVGQKLIIPTESISNFDTNCGTAEFVTDVSVPDGSQVPPGTAFVKTWRIRNSGSWHLDIPILSGLPERQPDGRLPVAVNLRPKPYRRAWRWMYRCAWWPPPSREPIPATGRFYLLL